MSHLLWNIKRGSCAFLLAIEDLSHLPIATRQRCAGKELLERKKVLWDCRKGALGSQERSFGIARNELLDRRKDRHLGGRELP